jgi:transposase
MKQYPDELKNSIIARMMPPNNESVPALSQQTGIPKDTLYAWRIKHRRRNQRLHTEQIDSASKISSADKFDIVVETAHMNEAELSEYCRRNGLYPEQIKVWQQSCRSANLPLTNRIDKEKNRELSKENKQLKAELRRKEKALAEAAALLVLKKKVQELWGGLEDD